MLTEILTPPKAHPLTPREMVTDAELRALAAGDADRAEGRISDRDQRRLALILPDICGELLGMRAAMRGLANPWRTDCPVADDHLRHLARIDWHAGTLGEPDQLLLAMVLPDICGELLARRRAMRGWAA